MDGKRTVLHWIGDGVREAMLAVPMDWVRVLFVGMLACVLVWVLLLPRERVSGAEGWDGAGSLRWLAAAALVIQIVIYCVL